MAADDPGILYRDLRDMDDQVLGAVEVIRALNADILVLTDVDYDHSQLALTALRDAVGGPDRYPHMYSSAPNTGVATGLDLNGNGRLAEARDAQGYGRFPGQGGMAVLSRWPVALVADHSAMLWRDVPDTLFIDAKGRTGPDATGYDVQRLSSSVHWELRVTPPGSDTLTLMVFHATPPVFDGSEDRNGRRNADEVLFWRHRLDGAFGPPPEVPFAILGTFNLAPDRGQGLRPQLVEFLADPRLRDLPDLIGKPTAHWPDPGPGSLRVDYILPSADLAVRDATLMATDPQISRHQPIVVTLDLPQAADN